MTKKVKNKEEKERFGFPTFLLFSSIDQGDENRRQLSRLINSESHPLIWKILACACYRLSIQIRNCIYHPETGGAGRHNGMWGEEEDRANCGGRGRIRLGGGVF